MAVTYEPLATTTLSSTSSTITFSSISGSYTDLRIILVGTGNTLDNSTWMRFNSDTGTNYSGTYIYGDGSAVSTERILNVNALKLENTPGINTSPNPSFYTVDIFSYAGGTYKTALTSSSSDRNGSGYVIRGVGLWRNTDAITSISLIQPTKLFSIGTTATLYGILRAT